MEEEQVPREASYVNPPEEEAETRYTTRGRKIRKPEWYEDFIFSLFRCVPLQMVNTKITPRKTMAEAKQICPVCKNDLPRNQTFEQHVVTCARDKVGTLSKCEICKRTFIKDEYRRRHMKREHGQNQQGAHSCWDSDPDVDVSE